MTFALVFLCLAVLTLAALLARQVGLTRKANEGLAEWKRLFERARHDHAALLSRYRALERRDGGVTPRPGREPGRSKDRAPGPKEQAMTRPAPAATSATDAAPVAEPLTLVLPIRLLSKNARDKLHYRARHRLRQSYRDIIQAMYPRRGPPPQVKQRATVTRVLGPRERRFDQQNVGAGSAVELIDALTACGYWVDDGPGWLEAEFKQGDCPGVKGPAVVVEIEALA